MRRIVIVLVVGAAGLRAQLDTRENDPLGLSIRQARIQVIHSSEPRPAGTSLHLQQFDPWLAYEMGWYLFARQWSAPEGLFRAAQQHPMTGAANSCAMCHSHPFHTAGAGGNFSDAGGNGRKTRHLFGVGLIETLGIQIRQQILAQFDTNRNGFLDYPAETRNRQAVIEAAPGVSVDFGPLDDLDGDGLPDLNDVIQPFLVDARGQPATGRRLGNGDVAGYDFAVNVLSSSAGDHQLPGLRLFSIGVLQSIFGLPVHDEVVSTRSAPGQSGIWAKESNAGAPQLYFALGGKSDGACQYVSAGDLDLLEWFLMNYPPPAIGRQNQETRRGQKLMAAFSCTSCHVEDWRILPADAKTGMPGDRRFFHLDARAGASGDELLGHLQDLTRTAMTPDGAETRTPRRGPFTVHGIYSDLRYHDVGNRFYDYTSYDGTVVITRRFRTSPLWGIASSGPYAHDGRSATLDEAIRRHGGEAEESIEKYVRARASDRQALIGFLQSLVLYDPAAIPADINGDGRIDSDYLLGGSRVGPERLRPEFLFRTVPRYRGWVTGPDGDRFFSYEMTNPREVFHRDLPALHDSGSAGIPDLATCKASPVSSQPGLTVAKRKPGDDEIH